jgi:hypothetical protein
MSPAPRPAAHHGKPQRDILDRVRSLTDAKRPHGHRNPEHQRLLTEKKLYQLKSLWLYPRRGAKQNNTALGRLAVGPAYPVKISLNRLTLLKARADPLSGRLSAEGNTILSSSPTLRQRWHRRRYP